MLYAFLVGVGFSLVPFPTSGFFLIQVIFIIIRSLGMIVTIFAGILLLTEIYTHLKGFYGSLIQNLAIAAAVILALVLIFYWGLF
ncbi:MULTISPECIES: hypothetical protein [Paenibacillus]|uniref:hypothetical protein n=1 Tax=Paenibacillus TaxID=44249 RepID=UPI00048CE788|nr:MULTISPECIES: hypothetical protein [Paenibacillus]SME94879.1 hypothetical protein SAMN02744102_00516 [Paenibacillus barengoltzii]